MSGTTFLQSTASVDVGYMLGTTLLQSTASVDVGYMLGTTLLQSTAPMDVAYMWGQHSYKVQHQWTLRTCGDNTRTKYSTSGRWVHVGTTLVQSTLNSGGSNSVCGRCMVTYIFHKEFVHIRRYHLLIRLHIALDTLVSGGSFYTTKYPVRNLIANKLQPFCRGFHRSNDTGWEEFFN